MATLTVETATKSGLTITMNTAAGGGDAFANDGKTLVYIDNGGGGSITLTIVTQKTVDGLAVADQTVAVPNGTFRHVGPFDKSVYNDSNGRTQLTYSGVSSVTVGIMKVPPVVDRSTF